MLSNKKGIQHLVGVLKEKGIRKIVMSPGSRNAPLVITFEGAGHFECINVPDERVAGYFALGIALESGEPVAVVCSSGTASANYIPSAAEAFYQHVPIIYLTADRPVEWVDQGDGQTIRQRGIFGSHVKHDYQIPQETTHPDELWSIERMANEAVDVATTDPCGPVHINVPLREPLYNTVDGDLPEVKLIEQTHVAHSVGAEELDRLADTLNKSQKVLILCGQMRPDGKLNHILDQFAEEPNIAVITETTANQYSRNFNPCIDRLITSISDEEKDMFMPDVLITMGNMVVSKKIKALLRTHRPKQHWHVSVTDHHFDVFQSLTHSIRIPPNTFLRSLQPKLERNTDHQYSNRWRQRHFETEARHEKFLAECKWSDLRAFQVIMDFVPDNSTLHMGNSTSVRYVQLFNQPRGVRFESNRGTSGIDGSVSTASGFAHSSSGMNTLVTGDISFFYDSNGLWHYHHKGNLRIIVINNGGGGIFRIIDGPSSTPFLEKHFETLHDLNVEKIATQFGLDYYSVDNETDLSKAIPEFYGDGAAGNNAILEVFTPREENDVVLKDYFNALR